MRKYFLLFLALFLLASSASAEVDLMKHRVVPTYMAVQGATIAGMWTVEIAQGRLKDGFWRTREGENVLWPHITAEYLTATGLLIGAYGQYREKEWGRSVSLVSLGALAYTGLNSTAWSFAEKKRRIYALPMLLGLAGAGVSVGIIW